MRKERQAEAGENWDLMGRTGAGGEGERRERVAKRFRKV